VDIDEELKMGKNLGGGRRATIIRPLPTGYRKEKLGNRINYASSACAAKVLEANREATEASDILVGNLDKYSLNPCGADRYVVVELCEEIGVDYFTVTNAEYFSSTMKHLQVYGLDSYAPTIVGAVLGQDGGEDIPEMGVSFLGEYEADNVRTEQTFAVDKSNGAVWHRILLFRFRTHYESKYYCPLSSLKVYGTSMIEDAREQIVLSDSRLELVQRTLQEKEKDPAVPGPGGEGSRGERDSPPFADTEDPQPTTTVVQPPGSEEPAVGAERGWLAGIARALVSVFPLPLELQQKPTSASSHGPHLPAPPSGTAGKPGVGRKEDMPRKNQGRRGHQSLLASLTQSVKQVELSQSLMDVWLEDFRQQYVDVVSQFSKSLVETSTQHTAFAKELENLRASLNEQKSDLQVFAHATVVELAEQVANLRSSLLTMESRMLFNDLIVQPDEEGATSEAVVVSETPCDFGHFLDVLEERQERIKKVEDTTHSLGEIMNKENRELRNEYRQLGNQLESTKKKLSQLREEVKLVKKFATSETAAAEPVPCQELTIGDLRGATFHGVPISWLLVTTIGMTVLLSFVGSYSITQREYRRTIQMQKQLIAKAVRVQNEMDEKDRYKRAVLRSHDSPVAGQAPAAPPPGPTEGANPASAPGSVTRSDQSDPAASVKEVASTPDVGTSGPTASADLWSSVS